MIKDHKSLISNCFEGSIQPLIGETIKGCYYYNDGRYEHKVIIFESGYSLQLLSNGSYWIDNKDDTTRIVKENFHNLKEIKKNLQYMANLTGEEF